MRALDQLKAAVSMKPQRKSIELPNGSEFVFWATPVTLAERAKAQKQSKSDSATDFALQMLVMKARDEDGQLLFTVGDIPELRNTLPADLMEDLMLQLVERSAEEGDEAVTPKPSKPSSGKTPG